MPHEASLPKRKKEAELTVEDVQSGRIDLAALVQASQRRRLTELKLAGTPRTPFLQPVAPPKGRTFRGLNPFDFFGTLFTQPGTAGLNQNQNQSF